MIYLEYLRDGLTKLVVDFQFTRAPNVFVLVVFNQIFLLQTFRINGDQTYIRRRRWRRRRIIRRQKTSDRLPPTKLKCWQINGRAIQCLSVCQCLPQFVESIQVGPLQKALSSLINSCFEHYLLYPLVFGSTSLLQASTGWAQLTIKQFTDVCSVLPSIKLAKLEQILRSCNLNPRLLGSVFTQARTVPVSYSAAPKLLIVCFKAIFNYTCTFM